jgi:hypothetical protein
MGDGRDELPCVCVCVWGWGCRDGDGGAYHAITARVAYIAHRGNGSHSGAWAGYSRPSRGSSAPRPAPKKAPSTMRLI